MFFVLFILSNISIALSGLQLLSFLQQAGRDEEFLGLLNGHAHYAILCGALKILRETKSELIRLLDKYPEYKLVVTGHSLGAGTAVLATLEILLGSDPFVAPSRVKCIALAPPPGFLFRLSVSLLFVMDVNVLTVNTYSLLSRKMADFDSVPFFKFVVHFRN